MKPVSQNYLQQIQYHRTRGFRNGWVAQVYMGVTDAATLDQAAYSVSGQVSFSDWQNIVEGANITTSYLTWEQNFFRVDGSQTILPSSAPYAVQGWVSDSISGEDGTFSTPPYIEVDFSSGPPVSFAGISLDFDLVSGQVPSEYIVTTYSDGSLVDTYTIENTNLETERRDVLQISNITSLKISFTKTTSPYNRVRVNSFVPGITFMFGTEDIISIDQSFHMSPLNLDLPQNNVAITLYNSDGRFTVGAGTSVAAFLEEGQEMLVAYGYLLDDGSVQWLYFPKYYLESWSVDGLGATFRGSDIYSALQQSKYYEYSWSDEWKPLSQVAQEALENAGVSSYYIEENIGQLYGAPPYLTYAELLQLIASAGRCYLGASSSAQVKIFINSSVPEQYLTASASGGIVYSTAPAIGAASNQWEYSTWEPDFFSVDGLQLLAPESAPFENTGFVAALPSSPGTVELSTTDSVYNNVKFNRLYVDTGNYSAITTLTVSCNDGPPQVCDYDPALKIATGNFATGSIKISGFGAAIDGQRLRVKALGMNWAVEDITNADVINNVNGAILPKAKNVVYPFTSYQYTTSDNGTILTTEIPVGESVMVEHSDAIYTNISATCSVPNVTISAQQHYAFVSFITLESSDSSITNAEITLTGTEQVPQSVSGSAIYSVNVTGEDFEINNPLPLDNSFHPVVAEAVGGYLNNRAEYTIETLGYPELDPGDRISLNGAYCTITDMEILFNSGAMRETFVLRGEDNVG